MRLLIWTKRKKEKTQFINPIGTYEKTDFSVHDGAGWLPESIGADADAGANAGAGAATAAADHASPGGRA